MDGRNWYGATLVACTVLGTVTSFVGFSQSSFAQNAIAPDSTLPQNTVVNFNNNTYTITGGTQVGANQFHSFNTFSVPTQNTAHFDNALQTANVIGRVTGNSSSDIDGTLRTNGAANLYLINPNGIIFGQNARLDIGGSFTASTANSIKFSDGSEFSATNPQAPPLLKVNVPIGLQLGKSEVGATITNRGNLSAGQDLTLASDRLDLQGRLQAGRDLTLQAQDITKIRDTVISPLVLTSGRDMTVQGTQSVDIFALNHPNSRFYSGGDMKLRSTNAVIGDAHYYANGNFKIENLDGKAGDLHSLNDPIIRSLGDVTIGIYLGRSLHILAGGSVTMDTAIINGVDTTNNTINPTNTPNLADVLLSNGSKLTINGNARPTLDIRAGMNPSNIGTSGITGTGLFFDPSGSFLLPPPSTSQPSTGTGITIGDIWISAPNGVVLLTNNYKPNPLLPSEDIRITGTGFFGWGIDTSRSVGNGGSVFIDSRGRITSDTNISTYSTAFTGNGGNVSLIANGNINIADINTTSRYSNAGNISLLSRNGNIDTRNGLINASAKLGGYNGGQVILTAGQDILSGSIDTFGGFFGAGSDISLNARSVFVANSAKLLASTYGQGNAGNITINATDSVYVTDKARLVASTYGQGNGGNVSIKATDSVLFSSSNILSGLDNEKTSVAVGQAGNISINARFVSFTGGSFLSTSTFGASGQGNAGNITITANGLGLGSIYFTDGSALVAVTSGQGNAGNIFLTATDTVSFARSSQLLNTVESGAIGNGGNININARSVSVTGNSIFSSSTYGQGNAGNITITTTDMASFDYSAVGSVVGREGVGNGGDVTINARSVSLTNGAQLNASTFGQGNAGNIFISAIDTVLFSGTGDGYPSGAFSAVESSGVGNGGNVTINAHSLSLIDGAKTTSTTKGQGNAGSINISLSQVLMLDGTGTLIAADTRFGSSGNGGSIFIDPPLVSITNGAGISVNSLGTGNGGNMDIFAGKFVFANNAFLTANTASGEGGNINLRIADIFFPRNGSSINATAGNNGNGGNINLSALFLVSIPSENNDIFANASFGKGGNINITANGIFGFQSRPRLTPLSDITASSDYGVQGTVNINTMIDPSKGLNNLPVNVSDPSRLVKQSCIADRTGSSFTITGKGGVPAKPSDRPTDMGVLDNFGTLGDRHQTAYTPSSPDPQQPSTPNAIVEATGWIVNAQKQVVLVAGKTPTPSNIRCPQ